jgi:lipopolysaccharide export system protein LptA
MTVPPYCRTTICALLIATSTASPAAAEPQSSGAVLPGGNSKDPVNIDAAKLDYFDKEQKLVYTGNVVLTQGEGKLQAGTLIIFLAPKNAKSPASAPSSSSQVRRMEVPGPVTVLSKDQIGTGDSGVYERSENKVYLIGNVTLTQGPNVTKGDKLIYDLTTKEAVVTGGRVRSLFVPDDKTGNARDTQTARSVGVTKADQGAQASGLPAPQHAP